MTPEELDAAVRPAVQAALAEQAAADTTEQIVASTPPVGVSSRQIFVVALLAICGWLVIAAYVMIRSPDPSDRAAVLQASIAMATLAFGFYLGSSASSRNKDHRP